MRTCHYIKPNHTTESPTRAAFISLRIEKLGVFDGITKYEWFGGSIVFVDIDKRQNTRSYTSMDVTTAEEIWNLITTAAYSKIRRYVWIENANLTLGFLDAFNAPLMHGWKMTHAVIPPGPTIIKYRRGTSSVTLLDMSNIWRQPLSGISTGANSAPSSDNCDGEKPLPGQGATVYRAIEMMNQCVDWWDFLKKNDLGGFSPTSGSQSFRTWRHRYMTHPVLIDLHDDALALAREGFYGGRCECYKIGEVRQKVYELDLTSAYPYAMRQARIPTRLLWYSQYTEKQDIDAWLDDHIIIAECVVNTLQPLFPVRHNGMCLFPTGRFRTVLAGLEFYVAYVGGVIESVQRAACYQADYAFTSYMDALWVHRSFAERCGNRSDYDKWKLLGSSFYGKWAQRGGVWEDDGKAEDLEIKSWIDVDVDSHAIEQYRQFGGRVQKLSREHESRESSPAIAACIAAYVRCELARWIDECGRENVYYVDTDALLVNAVGLGRVFHKLRPGEFGGIRIKNEYDRVTIYGPKHYRPHGRLVHAGVSADAIHIDASTIRQAERTSISASIASNRAGRVIEFERTKHFTKAYTKGKVKEDGSIEPLELT